MPQNSYIQHLRLDTDDTGALGEQASSYKDIGNLFAELISEELKEKEYSATERTVYRIISGHDIKRTDRLKDLETNITHEVISFKRVDNDYTDYICESKDE